MMFRRARLRLTLLYIALMGVTLVLVAGGILLLGAEQARRTEDQSLRLRAERLAQLTARFGPGPRVAPDRTPTEGNVILRGRIEQEGILDYPLPVDKNRVLDFPSETVVGLPSIDAAQAALDTGESQYRNVSVDDGEVRVYSMPVYRSGEPVAVIQVARSSYFVDATITRLLLIVAGAGAVGLVFSAGASFWLAGRTLQPIATALQRQRDFTADASHELRTPLALVRGNAELMLRHPDKPIGEYDDVVQDIVDESDRLGRLVSDLLTLARADSGHVQIVRRHLDLSGVAAQSLHTIEPLAHAKGLRVRGDITPDIAVVGDTDRLHQLCLVLLDNAVRYTGAGTVTLRLARDGHNAVLSVHDTGTGIGAEHLDRLFDRFYRTDEARSAEAGGTGLGLAIAKWIAEVHGGRIAVTSTPGAGSMFTVHLPRVAAERRPAPAYEDRTA